MSMNRIARVTLLGALAAFPIAASAQVYKWIDDDGRTIVSDTPPPGKTKAQQIRKGTATPDAQDPSATAAGDKPKADKSEKSNKSEKTAAEGSKKILIPAPPDKATCNHARQNLQALESGAQLNTKGPGGERVLMDDSARAQELARVRETLRNCQN
jgi:hypothetical protein